LKKTSKNLANVLYLCETNNVEAFYEKTINNFRKRLSFSEFLYLGMY